MFKTATAVAALVILCVVAGDFVFAYVRSKSTGFQRLIDAARGSATILAAQLGAIAAALVTAGGQITDWICAILNAPDADSQIKSFIGSYFTATNVGLAMLAYTLIVAAARARTLKR